MTTFDDRERAYEAKFAHDAEMLFRAEARRNKLVGLWASELMGKTGDQVHAYVVELMKADFQEPGHEDVVRKLVKDLDGLATEREIRQKMDQLLVISKGQLVDET